MKDHTTAEIFEELWKRIEYDANVSEELASESNELQARINKALEYIENWQDDNFIKPLDKIEPFNLGKLYKMLKGENDDNNCDSN